MYGRSLKARSLAVVCKTWVTTIFERKLNQYYRFRVKNVGMMIPFVHIVLLMVFEVEGPSCNPSIVVFQHHILYQFPKYSSRLNTQ